MSDVTLFFMNNIWVFVLFQFLFFFIAIALGMWIEGNVRIHGAKIAGIFVAILGIGCSLVWVITASNAPAPSRWFSGFSKPEVAFFQKSMHGNGHPLSVWEFSSLKQKYTAIESDEQHRENQVSVLTGKME